MNSDISAWSVHASILSFAPLYLLLVAAAATLFIACTKPGSSLGVPWPFPESAK